MKALRVLRSLSSTISKPHFKSPFNLPRFYSETQTQLVPTPPEDENGDGVFDSSQFAIPSLENLEIGEKVGRDVGWNERFRERADEKIFGKKVEERRGSKAVEREEQKRRRAAILARSLLEAALEKGDEEDEEVDCLSVKEEDQKSLSVGIIGAPNAGKSALTNFMVGTKVAAVSRKTNTTTHEVLGVMTKGNTQICFFDTPGLILNRGGYPSKDIKVRVECAWSAIDLYDVLIVIFDVHRHLNRPDSRVVRLIERMGSDANPKQKRILCMNKVDLVEKKKDLLKVAEQFKELPGYEKYFMISGLKGSGVKDLAQFLMEQAVKRPWDEDPLALSEEVMKNISLEVVRERLLDHIHQEIPYGLDHRLVDWKELRDGSIRIEQHLITHKLSQRKILVGKNGSKIGRIGVEANEELRSIFKRNVHLILQVRLK
ncbi:GTP-binding protein ERG [Heracleum sosnowskyi]|uniref:GTP-binding protein ERG n=1 Tax=Heracleum sosnowskyi TaxID=360622 RepID=A0AAD8IWZ1_9APIA|nr:GTP-binding protein ERG [Heracleum sosnowskyi]